MTDPHELDRLLGDYFADGTDELADRVIDAALDQIDHTHQRRRLRAPWRFPTMSMPTRVAAAAIIGVLAVGGAFYLTRPDRPAVGSPSPEPSASLNASMPASPSAGDSLAVVQTRAPAWTATGGMTAARTRHTATLLLDGKVLVVGGSNGSGALASAELYDPMDGSWTSAGNMIRGRVDHTATLLRDGRVLVVGGMGTGSQIIEVGHSAELYDPATGSWSAAGRMKDPFSMEDPFFDHTATLLPDGRVLVAGGGSAELYDPASGTWRATGKMIEQRYFHTATLLPDGRVLVAGGGCCVANRSLVSAEIYDPGTGTWSAAGRMIESRMYHTAMLLSDGNVLITGGSGGSKSGTPIIPLASPELYDPISGTWTATGEMRAVRCCLPTFTLLADGAVLAAGGVGESGGLLASAELYDSSSGTWTATVNMHEARAGQTATLLLNGTVLVAGGTNGLVSSGNPIPVTSAELYDPGNGN